MGCSLAVFLLLASPLPGYAQWREKGCTVGRFWGVRKG